MLNTTVPETSWHSPYGIIVQVIVWFVVIIVSLETIIGNAMVVIAYKIERNISKQVSNRYIVSLAISDLIIGIEGFPLFTVYVLNGERWPLGPIACETWLFLDYTLCLVSILTVLLITADRYLSVCHTAKYLKWQSPTKTQLLIILSWLIPAIIFGIMIYGWGAMTGGSESMTGTECSAPFLSNPYVNMGMYVAYYWTTLVAMLILYKGIHQAAKNLEKKAKAKERRHIALILSQRLGTQVGVSLMLQSRTNKETKSGEDERTQRDSGYQTTTTASIYIYIHLSVLDAVLLTILQVQEIHRHWSLILTTFILRLKNHSKKSNYNGRKDGTSSSCEEGFTEHSPCGDRPRVLQVTVTEQEEADGRFNPEPSKSDTFLSASGTITFIVGCFAVLWSPYYIMATVYGFCKGECIPSFLYTLSYYMCYLNSSGNPFAYALANRQFRSAFLRMFKGNFNRIA
uniref:G_PROTEIN_RECEP_F1_2 domain-containing protein n=1 Tax=Heterorhabditis bacteriophora TaxID=37862 RepID=A0A1I7XCY7_HETBA